jgi:hypothetical protein
MQQLEPEDVQKLLQTIQQLYSFVDMETFLDQSSLAIDRLVPSDTALFVEMQPEKPPESPLQRGT